MATVSSKSPSGKPNLTWQDSQLTTMLRIAYPIVQGPLGGFASQRLTAAVSNFGGLGSFGAHGLSPESIKTTIAEIRALTSKPFAINLWVSMEDGGAFQSDAADFAQSLAPLAPALEAHGVSLPTYQQYRPIRFEDQAHIVIESGVPVFSFICGIPPRDILDACRSRNIRTIGGATTPDEARALQDAGVDIVVASGFEAGGHRGSFLRPSEDSLTGTFSLVPQIRDAVSIPVIAAGGIADARGVIAALILGANGVQMATAFLPSEQSGANRYHRAALVDGEASRTALTKGITGRLARGIQNQLIDRLNAPGTPVLPYPLQRALVKHLTSAAEKAGDPAWMTLWAGQSASLSRDPDILNFLQTLVEDVSAFIS